MKTVIGISLMSVIGLSFVLSSKKDVVKTDDTYNATINVAENYRVIKVNGHILYASKGGEMTQGDVFNATEQLTFKTDDSKAAVISKTQGRKILSPKNGRGSKPTLLPPMNNISSRSGGLNNLIDLQNHFDGDYLVLGTSKLRISDQGFPMNESAFFYMRYAYNGEVINKKLPFEVDKLILNTSEIFKIDGNPIDSKMVDQIELFYLSDKTSTQINTFKLVSPNHDDLVSEITIISDEIKDQDQKLNEITSYLNEYYGKASQDNLKEWVSKYLK